MDVIRVLICGSRGWHDPFPIDMLLAGADVLADGRNERAEVVHGAARGADTLAGNLAKNWGIEVHEEPADWDRYGKAAGPIRNKKMLDDYKPDVVFAFRTSGKSSGTDDMCKQAKDRGIRVYVVTAWEEEDAGDDGEQLRLLPADDNLARH